MSKGRRARAVSDGWPAGTRDGEGAQAAQPACLLTVALFGRFMARCGDQALTSLRSHKSQELLALLALHLGRSLDRSWLAGTLWPETTDRLALFYLRRTLVELRHWLGAGEDCLSTPTSHAVRLNLTASQVDVAAFDTALAPGDIASLEQAVALYRGPLLEGWEQQWVQPERAAREEACLTALEALAARATEAGELPAAVRHLRRVIAVDPFREGAQRALMQALVADGDRAAAIQAYHDFCRLLQQELDTEPAAQTTALFETLRRQPLLPPEAPSVDPLAPAARGRQPRNLPRPLNRFIGREKEVQEVRTRLAADRLVTLTGLGGIGKTRLAIQVADQIAMDYLHGVCFIDLARLADPALVPRAVAAALALKEQPDRSLTETVLECLRDRHLLLVFDNCEHLLSACAELVDVLLSACPELRVLATSRQSLGLTGELVYQLAGLSLPPPVDGQWSMVNGPIGTVVAGPSSLNHQPSTVLQDEAIRLFVDRARGAKSTFALTEQNAGSVVQICRRLDGIPLAIELAAVRLKVLSASEIANRLDDRFRLLTAGSRTAPPRQQTLQAAMEWSYDLLPEPVRVLLRRLAVFAGGCTLEAAVAVCSGFHFRTLGLNPNEPDGTERDDGSSPEVLDLLTHLVDSSLVYVEEQKGETRYRLLETTRDYALRRLAEVGEEAAVRERHRDWYLSFAERADAALHGPEQVLWLDRLDADQDNLRGALDWSLQVRRAECGATTQVEPADRSWSDRPHAVRCTPHLEAALRMGAALAWFWWRRGHHREGRDRLLGLVKRVECSDTEGGLSDDGSGFFAAPPCAKTWARVLHAAGRLSAGEGELDAAQGYYEAALDISRRIGDRHGEARELLGLGVTQGHRGALPRAGELYEQSLSVARESGDSQTVALALNNLGIVRSYLGDQEAARSYFEEALTLFRSSGVLWGISLAASNVAGLLEEEESARAERLYEECLVIERALGNQDGILFQLANLTGAAMGRGDLAAAQGRIQELWDVANEREWVLCHVADVCLERGHPAVARPLLEQSLEIRLKPGSRGSAAEPLRLLGYVARAEGDRTEARGFFARSLSLYRDLGRTDLVICLLEDLAGVDVEGTQAARAARLMGAAEALRETLGLPLQVDRRADWERGLSRARSVLGKEAFCAAWAEGEILSLEDAVALALEEPSAV